MDGWGQPSTVEGGGGADARKGRGANLCTFGLALNLNRVSFRPGAQLDILLGGC